MSRGGILQTPEPLSLLLSDAALSLADWYGEPLECAQADRWARRLQRKNAHATVPARFRDRLAELVARYWSGRDAAMSYHSLLAAASDDFEEALLELGYGQLLLARKQPAAWRHLSRGFTLAAHQLPAADYFRVMKRHQALAVLPLSADGAASFSLDSLLREAAVIEKLAGGAPRNTPPESGHLDTLD